MGSLGLSHDELNFLMKLEMDLEEECLVPVPEIRQRIIEIHENYNAKIVFISNMYLPGDFIKKQLLRHDIACLDNPVYVSGDIGLAKHTGNLFKYVLKKHNLRPEQLVHTGDNLKSDIKAAQKLGIHTIHYTGASLTNRESIIASQKQSDQITNSLIAGASRLCRTRLRTRPDFNEFDIGPITSIAAPMLTAFTAWVLKNAQQDGVERLYFLSRDGQLFFEIAQILSRGMPAPECRYLYSSRLAWVGAAINETKFETDGIRAICIGNTAKSPAQIFERLGIQRNELSSDLLSKIDLSYDDLDNKMTQPEAETFCTRLKTNQNLKQLILDRAAKRRETTLAYLEQEGLLDDNHRWAIVDVGWRLNSQKALYDLLKMTGYKQSPIGYYFGLSSDRHPECATGPYKAFTLNFSKNMGTTAYWAASQSSVALLENVFLLATHPPLSSYVQHNGKISPIYSRTRIHSRQIFFAEILHKTVIDFVDCFSSIEELLNNMDKVRESTLLSWKEFVNHPFIKEVSELQWLPVNIEFSHDPSHTRKLASPITINNLIRILQNHVSNLQHYENPNHIWLEGSASLSSPMIRWAFFIMQKIRRYLAG